MHTPLCSGFENGAVVLPRQWRQVFLVIALAICATMARADLPAMTVTVNKMQEADISFPVRGYRVGNESVVRLTMTTDQKINILGLSPGVTDVLIQGDGERSEKLTITVIADIAEVLAALKKDLEDYPEFEFSTSLGRIQVKGNVSSLAHHNYLKRVLKQYAPLVSDLTKFKIAPEAILQLKKSLASAGFNPVDSADPAGTPPGVLEVKLSGDALYLSGSVYSQRDIARVGSIVAAQKGYFFLSGGEDKADADSGAIPAIVTLNVAPALLELDVAFVGVSDVELKQVGVNIAKEGLLFLRGVGDTFHSAVRGGDSESITKGSFLVGTDLNGTLKFFASTGPGRFQTAGHMTFRNDAPDEKVFQSGGTLQVRVVSDNTAGLQPVDYGLILRTKGGLLNAQDAAVDMDVELSYPIPMGGDYDLKKNRLKTSITCPLGKTFVMAGMNDLLETTSKAGVPYLRSIPVISWFFSEANKALGERKVLILASVRMAPQGEASAAASDLTVGTKNEAALPLAEREKLRK